MKRLTLSLILLAMTVVVMAQDTPADRARYSCTDKSLTEVECLRLDNINLKLTNLAQKMTLLEKQWTEESTKFADAKNKELPALVETIRSAHELKPDKWDFEAETLSFKRKEK